MTSPIKNQIGSVFIPVSDIEVARDWYCSILQLSTEGEILFGHLFIVPMQGTAGIILDSKIYSPEKVFQTPAFQFITDDIEQSYQYLQENGVELVTGIENGQWFNFKDPDGNLFMVCK
ncbi:VOC family protein [Paenibacillus sp. KN14-4R]|uniref:VOC family protein n=1 Tax=Paenibacillus sp. KN14-4R TaxID=3445773 RepID=UPI003F9F6D42